MHFAMINQFVHFFARLPLLYRDTDSGPENPATMHQRLCTCPHISGILDVRAFHFLPQPLALN